MSTSRVYVRPGEKVDRKTGKVKRVKEVSHIPLGDRPNTFANDLKFKLDRFAWDCVPFYRDVWISREGERTFDGGPTGVWTP